MSAAKTGNAKQDGASKDNPATAEGSKADQTDVSPPREMPGFDPKNRAFDPSVRTKDLTPAERRARRQMRKERDRELAALAMAPRVEVAPIAKAARMRPRHWGIVSSFLVFVILPLAMTLWYLQERAVDMYASTVAFTVQQQQGSAPSDFLTGVAAQVGGGGVSDTEILYEFIQSQQLVAEINADFDLLSMYSENYAQDPIFGLQEDATLEELVDYWSRVVRISYDESARLIELRVLAYEPEVAQAIAREIVAQSQVLINQLNAQAREDTIRYAQIDLEAAESRLSVARSDLIVFRTRTQIVDPETDLAGRLGVVNTLQQELAAALVDFDLLSQSTNPNDPRVIQAQQRIDVIRARLTEERANVTQGQELVSGDDYPTLLAEYEGLIVAREIAEQMYRAALTSLESARADAARQSRYLAAYIQPTLPESAEFPQRFTLFGLACVFIFLAWSIVVLVYYSVRDSR